MKLGRDWDILSNVRRIFPSVRSGGTAHVCSCKAVLVTIGRATSPNAAAIWPVPVHLPSFAPRREPTNAVHVQVQNGY